MPAFATAIEEEKVVTFSYSKPTEPRPLRRVVSPWELQDDGATVIGWDHDRDGIRKFSLGNIVGTVEEYTLDDYVRPAT